MSREEYNWLDDPFDEKKNARLEASGMSKGSKTAFLLGMLALLIVIVVLFVLVGASLLSFATV